MIHKTLVMRAENISPLYKDAVRFLGAGCIIQNAYKISDEHDIWHDVSGISTTKSGEILVFHSTQKKLSAHT